MLYFEISFFVIATHVRRRYCWHLRTSDLDIVQMAQRSIRLVHARQRLRQACCRLQRSKQISYCQSVAKSKLHSHKKSSRSFTPDNGHFQTGG